jgi:LacI family transcriptional regulator
MPSSPSRVTQADVARRAGVSRTTVSFVLSGREDTRISV